MIVSRPCLEPAGTPRSLMIAPSNGPLHAAPNGARPGGSGASCRAPESSPPETETETEPETETETEAADQRPGARSAFPLRHRGLALEDLAPVEYWSGCLAVAACEVLTGTRPVQQLTRWLEVPVYGLLARRAGLMRRLGRMTDRPTHATLWGIRSATGVEGGFELSAVVHDGTRVRAVALRAVEFRARWRASALEIG